MNSFKSCGDKMGSRETVHKSKTTAIKMKFSHIESYFTKQSEFECTLLCKTTFVVETNCSRPIGFKLPCFGLGIRTFLSKLILGRCVMY